MNSQHENRYIKLFKSFALKYVKPILFMGFLFLSKTRIRFHNRSLKRILKTDPCPSPYLVKYSPDVLKKKTKFLDNFNMDKRCFMKINIESSPLKIWIRIPITAYYVCWVLEKINHGLFKAPGFDRTYLHFFSSRGLYLESLCNAKIFFLVSCM